MPARTRGFTLIEIMVVVVIIGILAAAVGPQLFGKVDKAKLTTVKADMASIEGALLLYKADNGFLPSTDQGLEALVHKPGGDPEPKNYPQNGYLKRMPMDPWKNEYIYLYPGEHGMFDIISLGADGEEGGDKMNKDIGNWDENTYKR